MQKYGGGKLCSDSIPLTQEHMGTICNKFKHKQRLFLAVKSGEMLAQLTQRRCGVSTPSDTQTPGGHSPGLLAVGAPLMAGPCSCK